MSNGYNIGVYGNGLFNDSDPSVNQQQLTEMQNSGFTTVILWSWHVQGNGDFHYNNTPAVVNGQIAPNLNPAMPKLVHALKTSGTVDKIFFGFGSGGVADFANMQNLLATQQGQQTLEANFSALVNALPDVDGFDFDMEESHDSQMAATIVTLTLLLNQLYGKQITYCPYYDEDFWFGCLAQVYQQNGGQQIVVWFNLQCYDGGAGNTAGGWISDLNTYQASTPLGIATTTAFIVPGYGAEAAYGTQCPADICQTLAGQNIAGAWIWNTGYIFANEAAQACGNAATPSDYAQAIIAGLNNSCP